MYVLSGYSVTVEVVPLLYVVVVVSVLSLFTAVIVVEEEPSAPFSSVVVDPLSFT